MGILHKTSHMNPSSYFSQHTLHTLNGGDTELSQPLSYLIITIKFTGPGQLERTVGLLSLLSPSQHPDYPDPGYKFRYDFGRMPPLAFPVGMVRQFVFPTKLSW